MTLDASSNLSVAGNIGVNGLTLGRGPGNLITNTVFGSGVMTLNTVGFGNLALGYFSLYSNTSGYYNTAVGYDALYGNTQGFENIAIGFRPLYNNTTGDHNIGIGYQAGNANTTGNNNIFIGYQTNGVAATDSNRTFIGSSSTTSTWGAGNLLLGSTTDSTERLQVTGTAKITSTLSVGDTSTTNIVNITGGAASNAELRLINGTTRQVRFASRGDISQVLLDADTWDLGIRTVASKFIFFATNGTERVRIDATGNVGIGATTVNTAAKLQVDSTTSGFLPPRMTSAQRTAISTPPEGLIIFQTDGVVGLYLYVNSAWKSLAIVN
jgi:hypothetical protein